MHLFTGVAAFSTGASTLHYPLKLLVEDNHDSTVRSSFKVRQGETLQVLHQLWWGLHFLIVDEISMVSAQQLQYADERLKEITVQ